MGVDNVFDQEMDGQLPKVLSDAERADRAVKNAFGQNYSWKNVVGPETAAPGSDTGIAAPPSAVMGPETAPSHAHGSGSTGVPAPGSEPAALVKPAVMGSVADASGTVTNKPEADDTDEVEDGQEYPDADKAYNDYAHGEFYPALKALLERNKPLTDDELAALRRRKRAEGIISGVGDLARSIANMIAVHNYAPSMYDHKQGMSEASKARWDKWKEERDKKDADFLNLALNYGKLLDADRRYKAEREDAKNTLEAAKAKAAAAAEQQAFDNGIKERKLELDKENNDLNRELKRELAVIRKSGGSGHGGGRGGSGGGDGKTNYHWLGGNLDMPYSTWTDNSFTARAYEKVRNILARDYPGSSAREMIEDGRSLDYDEKRRRLDQLLFNYDGNIARAVRSDLAGLASNHKGKKR